MSVTATAVIASAFFATDEADAASYKVQNGDTLWKIAQKHNVSVSDIKSTNNLTTDMIYPSQVLEIGSNSDSKQIQASNTHSKQTTISAQTTNHTYIIQRGDSLSKIASKHNISLENLMSWNNLTTTLVHPGHELVIKDPKTNGSKPNISNSPASNSTDYVVKSGDTLGKIATQHNTTVAKLKEQNNLTSDLILVGQKLVIGNTATSAQADSTPSTIEQPNDVSYNVDKLISTAKSMQGVGYSWAGTTPSGFDCSGFIYYVYNEAGMDIGRNSTDGFYNRSYYVNKPQVGDLVFFKNTYKSGISHMGVYLGNDQFIHAGTSTGVAIASVHSSYWSKHFEGYKRFY